MNFVTVFNSIKSQLCLSTSPASVSISCKPYADSVAADQPVPPWSATLSPYQRSDKSYVSRQPEINAKFFRCLPTVRP